MISFEVRFFHASVIFNIRIFLPFIFVKKTEYWACLGCWFQISMKLLFGELVCDFEKVIQGFCVLVSLFYKLKVITLSA